MHLITPRRRRLLQMSLWSVAAAGLLGAIGCEKRLDPREYGEVSETLPQIEGAEKPRPLPELQGEDNLPKGAERFFK